jgi:hypothetical protein
MRDMSEIARDYRGRGVEVLAVNVWEDEETFRAFAAGSGHDLRWVRADEEAARPFGLHSLPAQAIVDRDGTVRWTSGLSSLFGTDRAIRRVLDRLLGE